MKKNIFIVIAASIALFAGCAKEATTVDEVTGNIVKVTASLGSATTRVTTGSEVGKFAWESGDVIGIWTGEAFTPFTIEESSVGKTAGTFTGTVPAGGSIGFAVYPYCAEDTYADNIYTSRYSGGNYSFKTAVRLYAPAAAETKDYKFQHLCAYVKVTIKNLPAEAKYAFVETTKGNNFLTGETSADLSATYPKFTGGDGDFGFIDIPEHAGILPVWELYVPITTGEYDNKQFRITFFAEPVGEQSIWDVEMDKAVYNHKGFLQTGGVVNRGDLFSLPDIVFEGGTASGMSATIEGGLSWLSGAKIGLWDGSAFTEKTVASGGVAVGEFEGDIPAGATFAIAPTKGATIDGNTLSYATDTWNDYPTGAAIYGTIGEPASTAYLKSISFKHIGAVVRVTFNNLPATAKAAFLETGASTKYFFTEATCDLSAETPVLTASGVNDWCFIVIPDHSEGGKVVVDVPIAPGAYDANPMFNIELYEGGAFTGKFDGSKKNFNLESSGINRGDVFEVGYTF